MILKDQIMFYNILPVIQIMEYIVCENTFVKAYQNKDQKLNEPIEKIHSNSIKNSIDEIFRINIQNLYVI